MYTINLDLHIRFIKISKKKISIRVKNGYTKHFLNWLLYYYVHTVPIQHCSKSQCCILTLTNFRNRSSINVPQTPNDVFDGSWWDLHWSDLAAQLLRVVVIVVGLLYVVLLYITIFRKITPILKKDSLYNTVINCRELAMNYGNTVIYRSLCMVTCCQSNCKFSDCQISLNLDKLDQSKI